MVSVESEGLRFDSSWGLRIFSLSHAPDKTKKHLSLILYRAQNSPFLLFLPTNRVNLWYGEGFVSLRKKIMFLTHLRNSSLIIYSLQAYILWKNLPWCVLALNQRSVSFFIPVLSSWNAVRIHHTMFSVDDILPKDIVTPGSELLERLALELNREENPEVKNWTHLVWKMKIPADVRRSFADVKLIRKSPTREILEWVAAHSTEKVLSGVAKAIDEIQRNGTTENI